MPKKKQPYVYFCLEKQQVNPALRGKRLPELIELCKDEWETMDLNDRQPYIDTAKLMSENPNYPMAPEPTFHSKGPIEKAPVDDLAGKFDGFGRSFVALQTNVIQEKRFDKFMKDNIARFTQVADILQHRYHIMTVNVWMEDDANGDIIPVEIALVEMTIKNGIRRKFIQIIDPGEIPPGFKADMKLNSEKDHDIWTDNVEMTDAYEDVLDAMIRILTIEKNERYGGQGMKFNTIHGIPEPEAISYAAKLQLLPIYVMPAQRRLISGSLNWLIKQTKKDIDFMLYDLDYLFQQLVMVRSNDETKSKMSLGAAEAYLSRDIYLYMSSIACKYHSTIESTKCAGALASRYAYVICDFCCQIYEINPIEGLHMPWGMYTDYSLERSFQSNTSFSNTSSSFSETESFASVGIGEKPQPIELPIKTMPVFDSAHILTPFLNVGKGSEKEFKSEEEFLADLHLEECEFLEEQFYIPDEDDTRNLQDTLDTTSTSNSTNAFFENIPSPVFSLEYSLHEDKVASESHSDSFSTAYSS